MTAELPIRRTYARPQALHRIARRGAARDPALRDLPAVYDRQSQSEHRAASIAEGWGGPQMIAGPVLVIPYQEQVDRDGDRGRAAGRANDDRLARTDAGARCRRSDDRPRPAAPHAIDLRGGAVRGASPAAARGSRCPPISRGSGSPPTGWRSTARNCASGCAMRAGCSARRRGSRSTASGWCCNRARGRAKTGGSGFFPWLDARSLTAARRSTAHFASPFAATAGSRWCRRRATPAGR